MNIAQTAKKLRAAAEALEALLELERPVVHGTPEVARKIVKDLAKARGAKTKKTKRPYTKRAGLHWTQKPENRKRLRKILRDAQRTRLKLVAKKSA
jgi:hypothetical protein